MLPDSHLFKNAVLFKRMQIGDFSRAVPRQFTQDPQTGIPKAWHIAMLSFISTIQPIEGRG
jgi:hypothetical protein